MFLILETSIPVNHFLLSEEKILLRKEMGTLIHMNLSLFHSVLSKKYAFLNWIPLERQPIPENSVRLNVFLQSYITSTISAFDLFTPYLTVCFVV